MSNNSKKLSLKETLT